MVPVANKFQAGAIIGKFRHYSVITRQLLSKHIDNSPEMKLPGFQVGIIPK